LLLQNFACLAEIGPWVFLLCGLSATLTGRLRFRFQAICAAHANLRAVLKQD